MCACYFQHNVFFLRGLTSQTTIATAKLAAAFTSFSPDVWASSETPYPASASSLSRSHRDPDRAVEAVGPLSGCLHTKVRCYRGL